ncbi:hypothetical protein [Streptomyces sp. WAC 06738]|uniref:hypothetical protein n=1 Tax=Streptomyces sp. WAC 06738 TaxID=2203210 RepID=UPI000F7B8056|nr:hypothetical protein [Streptomyces sp. WAC 06738]
MAADALMAGGNHRRALAESLKARRWATRLLKAEPTVRRHVEVLGSLTYNQALMWERLGDGQKAISAGRASVYYYNMLSIIDPDHDHTGSAALRTNDQVTAHLADARARLARLLGAYGVKDDRRRRQLKAYSQDPDMPLYSEISRLEQQAGWAYKGLIGRSGYTREDFERIKQQGDEAYASFFRRFPQRDGGGPRPP